MSRLPTEITPRHHLMPHDPRDAGTQYLYRGYVIQCVPDGWSVMDPLRFGGAYQNLDPVEDEEGWGANMYQAMAVVNELVDGDVRRKSR